MSDSAKQKRDARIRRHRRVRKQVRGSAERPRLAVFRSNRHISAQVIDDITGRTLASASSLEGEKAQKGSDKDAAARVGALVAQRAIEKGVKDVVFDRGGYIYHGRVKALADADLVVLGTWVAGHFVIGQKPGDARRLARVPKLTGKRVALFLTYAIDPGSALVKLERAVTREGAEVVGGYAWKRSGLPAGVEDFVDGILAAVPAAT